jgi:hypothetical protein
MLAVTNFTPYVGVAPSTTTLQLDGRRCCGGLAGLGVCQPGHYGPAIMLPGSAPAPMSIPADIAPTAPHQEVFNPYATESKLKGLGALGGVRWDLLALSFGLGFAGLLLYTRFRKKH